MTIMDFLKAHKEDRRLEGEHITAVGVVKISEGVSSFTATCAAISGLKTSESREFFDHLGEEPEGAVGLSRVAWLKFCLNACDKIRPMLQNAISRMEKGAKKEVDLASNR